MHVRYLWRDVIFLVRVMRTGFVEGRWIRGLVRELVREFRVEDGRWSVGGRGRGEEYMG